MSLRFFVFFIGQGGSFWVDGKESSKFRRVRGKNLRACLVDSHMLHFFCFFFVPVGTATITLIVDAVHVHGRYCSGNGS